MIVADLNVSRRALLGAALSVPVAVGVAVPAPASAPTRWERALRLFRAAEGALAAVAHSEDDDVYDRAVDRFNAALKGLLRAPAPGAAALVEKLELTTRHLAWELTGGELCMNAILRDARRLACSEGPGRRAGVSFRDGVGAAVERRAEHAACAQLGAAEGGAFLGG